MQNHWPKMTKVVIRADSGAHIGQGHLARTQVLAEFFMKSGCSVDYLCVKHEQSRSTVKFGNVHFLADGIFNNSIPNRDDSDWLGHTQNEDVLYCERWIDDNFIPDLLIIDHYSIDKTFEKYFYDKGIKVLVIDDLFNRKHHCHFLLDHNLSGPDHLAEYKSQVNESCKIFLGPEYAMIRSEFRDKRDQTYQPIDSINDIFLYMGTCSQNVYFEILKALETESFRGNIHLITNGITDLTIDFKKDFKELNVVIYEFCQDMAALMKKCDIGIGASGSTTWERCYMGLPSVVVQTAENQGPLIESSHRKQVAYSIGKLESTNQITWNDFFKKHLEDISFWNNLGRNGYKIFEGHKLENLLEGIIHGAY